MKTILALDDSPSVRQMVKMTLVSAGYAVVEANDGVEGLAKAKSTAVDMVVTDLNMPNMNGLAFIRAMRQLPAYKGTPIVFLSTESDADVKAEAKAAGATGWLTKPFKPDQLAAIAKKLLG